MKKYFYLLTAMALFAMNVQAQFTGGAGTEAEPYQVATAEQLQAVSDFPTASFVLTDDIDLSDIVWKPIANFTGHFGCD